MSVSDFVYLQCKVCAVNELYSSTKFEMLKWQILCWTTGVVQCCIVSTFPAVLSPGISKTMSSVPGRLYRRCVVYGQAIWYEAIKDPFRACLGRVACLLQYSSLQLFSLSHLSLCRGEAILHTSHLWSLVVAFFLWVLQHSQSFFSPSGICVSVIFLWTTLITPFSDLTILFSFQDISKVKLEECLQAAFWKQCTHW